MLFSLSKRPCSGSTLAYMLVTALAVMVTWMVHELAHWTVSEWLGYKTILTLNSAYLQAGIYDEVWHLMLVSAAGPAVTLIQAAMVFGHLVYRGWVKFFYPFLFVPFYMRMLAGLMNFFNLNDEGRISSYWNMGTFTLPIIVFGCLLLMVWYIAKKYKPGWKLQILTLLTVVVVSSLLILADQVFPIRLL